MINDNWICLYSDLPGGLRSGFGTKHSINKFFEQRMDKVPDLIFYRNNTVVICEVDHMLNEDYLIKFNLYKKNISEIINFFKVLISKKIENCKFYFIYKNKSKKEILKNNYKKENIKLFFFDNEIFNQ